MDKPATFPRELRLLLVTMVVSLAVLFVLSRFRFPERPAPAEPAPAPLERLAARATYDELASIIATLQERIAPALVTLRAETTDWPRGTRWVPGVRIAPELAVALLRPHERIVGIGADTAEAIGLDVLRCLVLVNVPPAPAFREAPLWQDTALPGEPRYVAVAEAAPGGAALRPLFVGRAEAHADSRWERPTFVLAAATAPPSASSALFTLNGRLLGLIAESGGSPVLVPGDAIAAAADRLRRGATRAPADLGIEVQRLDRSLAVATGANRGAVVSYVHPDGPSAAALQIGDVVVAVNGRAVAATEDLAALLSEAVPGSEISLEIVRHGAPATARVATAASTAGQADAAAGWTLRAVPGIGSEILHVRADTAASRAGLRRGDVVTRIGDRATPTPAEVARAFNGLSPGGRVIVGIDRGPDHLVVALEKR
jgi:S1-C subfamily serine protease